MIDLSGYLQETLYHSFLKKDILNLYQDRKKEKRMGLDAQIKQAKWICAPQAFISPVFQRRIHLTGRARGSIALSASGFFVLFVNGQRVGEDYYLSANSLFHARNLKDFFIRCRTALHTDVTTAYMSCPLSRWRRQTGDAVCRAYFNESSGKQIRRNTQGIAINTSGGFLTR